MSTRVHRVRSIWSAPFQRAGQSRPSPTLSAKARRKAVSLCVKSRWSCPAGKNMKNRKKREGHWIALMSPTMHHTMLWQNILLRYSSAIALVVIAWQLTFGLYSSLSFLTGYYDMYSTKFLQALPCNSMINMGGLKHSTTRSHAFTLVQFGAKFHSQSKRQHVS